MESKSPEEARVEAARSILREAMPEIARSFVRRLVEDLDLTVARSIARPGRRKGHWLVDSNLEANFRALGYEKAIWLAISLQNSVRDFRRRHRGTSEAEAVAALRKVTTRPQPTFKPSA